MVLAVFKTVARPHERSGVGSTPMHSRQSEPDKKSHGHDGALLAETRRDRQPSRVTNRAGENFRAGRGRQGGSRRGGLPQPAEGLCA